MSTVEDARHLQESIRDPQGYKPAWWQWLWSPFYWRYWRTTRELEREYQSLLEKYPEEISKAHEDSSVVPPAPSSCFDEEATRRKNWINKQLGEIKEIALKRLQKQLKDLEAFGISQEQIELIINKLFEWIEEKKENCDFNFDIDFGNLFSIRDTLGVSAGTALIIREAFRQIGAPPLKKVGDLLKEAYEAPNWKTLGKKKAKAKIKLLRWAADAAWNIKYLKFKMEQEKAQQPAPVPVPTPAPVP